MKEPAAAQLIAQGIWRHKKSGVMYEALCYESTLEHDPAAGSHVVYRDMVGARVWVRPQREFFDGRFEPLSDMAKSTNAWALEHVFSFSRPEEPKQDKPKVEMVKLDKPERRRTYRFREGNLVLLDVTHFLARKDTHRLRTADGKLHIVPSGWLHIEIEAEDWTL